MLSDLDQLMSARGIEAVFVSNHELAHSSFRWMTRGAKVTKGYAVKKVGSEPLFIHYPMERDEAASAGLPTQSIYDFDYDAIFKREANNAVGYAKFFRNILDSIGVSGPVAFVGDVPVHLYLELLENLEKSGTALYRSGGEDLIQLARKRKDSRELALIADVGRRTEDVVDEMREYLRGCSVNGVFVERGGKRVKIGDLKELVTAGIQKRNMVEDHETILSQGRDSAIPHSRGTASDDLRASVSLIIDIFPRDRDNGYFFDFTRTFCVGPVPDELRKVHQTVLDAFHKAEDAMVAGTPASTYQALVCDHFEAAGYPTTRSLPTTTDGYVHSLGHGVGLDVHEKPFFSLLPTNRDQIEVGDVLTIEPGLYFPDREIGVRIEDTLQVTAEGPVRTFCRSARGLEI